ncbi:hypothetical protein HSR121_2406 [Halapricum desulfuricans]|uniref:Uncharacterized protein n=1 Tax=Halapricum desulfuricans TaxID=2841257 RepID=A0A897N1Y5_9EURY|nr:hypothetical protein HSR121_2406 [Halapricum desulfuricans]
MVAGRLFRAVTSVNRYSNHYDPPHSEGSVGFVPKGDTSDATEQYHSG